MITLFRFVDTQNAFRTTAMQTKLLVLGRSLSITSSPHRTKTNIHCVF